MVKGKEIPESFKCVTLLSVKNTRSTSIIIRAQTGNFVSSLTFNLVNFAVQICLRVNKIIFNLFLITTIMVTGPFWALIASGDCLNKLQCYITPYCIYSICIIAKKKKIQYAEF